MWELLFFLPVNILIKYDFEDFTSWNCGFKIKALLPEISKKKIDERTFKRIQFINANKRI